MEKRRRWFIWRRIRGNGEFFCGSDIVRGIFFVPYFIGEGVCAAGGPSMDIQALGAFGLA
jgi:hypothetical protein